MKTRHIVLGAFLAVGVVSAGQAADIAAGKVTAEENRDSYYFPELNSNCPYLIPGAACHGANGVSTSPGFPNLAAQRAGYIQKQLKAYRSKKRKHPMTSGLLAGVGDAAIADVAAFYTSLPGAPDGKAKSKPPANYIAKRVALPADLAGFTYYFTFNHKGREQLRNFYANKVALAATGQPGDLSVVPQALRQGQLPVHHEGAQKSSRQIGFR